MMAAAASASTYFSQESVTSCFLNGSDPRIAARVSGARWDLNPPRFSLRSAQLLSVVVKAGVGVLGSAGAGAEEPQRSRRDEGPRYETHALNAPFK